MILVLQDSTTSDSIGEISADSAPSVGDTIAYQGNNYLIMMRVSPTLMRNNEKVIRFRVRQVS